MNVLCRAATPRDIPFLVEAIIAAEKSGSDKLSYSTIFGLSEAQVRSMLAEVLEEDVTGQELCVSGFKIAEVDGAATGAVCSWVEGEGHQSSTLLKANLLAHFVGRERLAKAVPTLRIVGELTLHREVGALQLESIYVPSGSRGRGITGQLIEAHLQGAPASCMLAQIIVASHNLQALAAYRKVGFATAREVQGTNPELERLLPSAHKLLLQRRLTTATD